MGILNMDFHAVLTPPPPATSCTDTITEHKMANFPNEELGAIFPTKDPEQ